MATPSRVGSGPPCRRTLTPFGVGLLPCTEPSPSLGPRIWWMGRPGGLPGAEDFPLVVRHPPGPATGTSRARGDFWIRFSSLARGRMGLDPRPHRGAAYSPSSTHAAGPFWLRQGCVSRAGPVEPPPPKKGRRAGAEPGRTRVAKKVFFGPSLQGGSYHIFLGPPGDWRNGGWLKMPRGRLSRFFRARPETG